MDDALTIDIKDDRLRDIYNASLKTLKECEQDVFESPYHAPEINSACHAWSCTPAYWIYRYVNEK